MAQTPQSMSNEPLYDAVYRNVLLGLGARTDVTTTSKRFLVTKPAPQKAGFVFYFRESNLNNAIESIALTTEATMTARTAMS